MFLTTSGLVVLRERRRTCPAHRRAQPNGKGEALGVQWSAVDLENGTVNRDRRLL